MSLWERWQSVWSGGRQPQPFVPEAGVYDMPVLSPYRPDQREPKLRTRKSPGDPRCPDCRASQGGMYVAVSTEEGKTFAVAGQRPAGACDAHQDAHYCYDPRWSVG